MIRYIMDVGFLVEMSFFSFLFSLFLLSLLVRVIYEVFCENQFDSQLLTK